MNLNSYAADTARAWRTLSNTLTYSRAELFQEKSFAMPLRMSFCRVPHALRKQSVGLIIILPNCFLIGASLEKQWPAVQQSVLKRKLW